MSQTVFMTIGEDHRSRDTVIKTYLFYVTPTGIDKGLTECPSMRRIGNRFSENPDTGTRISSMEYDVTSTVELKMMTSYTTFGKPKQVYQLYLRASEKAPDITIQGYGSFGGFNGRADLLLNKSFKMVQATRGTREPITQDDLRKVLGLVVRAPAKVDPSDGSAPSGITTRKPIW